MNPSWENPLPSSPRPGSPANHEGPALVKGETFYQHVFILRFWQESRESEALDPQLRGVVEHVASGQQKYVSDLNQACEIMRVYLYPPEPTRPRGERIRRWWSVPWRKP